MKLKKPSNSSSKHDWVAKYLNQFCKNSVQRDRKNDYRRKAKHNKPASYPEFIFA